MSYSMATYFIDRCLYLMPLLDPVWVSLLDLYLTGSFKPHLTLSVQEHTPSSLSLVDPIHGLSPCWV